MNAGAPSHGSRGTEEGEPLAWIGAPGAHGPPWQGQWGAPGALCLPLDDRGLLLADGIFETVLVAQGCPWLLAEHVERWHRGAALLGLPPPPGIEALAPLIAEAVCRSGLQGGALRLNWSRGSGGRGIELPSLWEKPLVPRFWLQLSPWTPTFQPVGVMVSRWERRHPSNPMNHCKTLAYGWAVQARREARASGADDALVCNTTGALCGGTTANLLLRLEGHWLTPPADSGCLPGVMRGRALALGLMEEAPLYPSQLAGAEGGLLLNSLDCRPLRLREGMDLHQATLEARRLWLNCLGVPAARAAPGEGAEGAQRQP